MKRIVLYVALAIFCILALISFRVTKEAVDIQKHESSKEPETTTGLPTFPKHTMLKEPETRATGLQSFPAEQAAQSLLLPENRPAITIIKPPAKENSSSFSGNVEAKIQNKETGSFSSHSNPAVSEKKSNIFSEKAEGDPAITKINKQPSEAESKEMNERGIIMY